MPRTFSPWTPPRRSRPSSSPGSSPSGSPSCRRGSLGRRPPAARTRTLSRRMVKPKILVLERSAELAEMIREATEDMVPAVEVVACSRVGAVTDVLQQEGPFTVLFAGPSLASRSGLGRLAAIHDNAPATSILLAFSDRPDASLRD